MDKKAVIGTFSVGSPRTVRKLFNSSLSLTAYPSYQVPFRERRVPFLLVKFHYIIAEKEIFCHVSLIFQICKNSDFLLWQQALILFFKNRLVMKTLCWTESMI